MKKWTVSWFVLLLLYPFSGLIFGINNFIAPPHKAVSLKTLQQKLAGYSGRDSIPPNLRNLCGITRIKGYMINTINQDVILIGTTDSQLPPLHLDDFVVALRNAWGKYKWRQGGNQYNYAPGCSIDPDPRIVNRLIDIWSQTQNHHNPQELNNIIEQWKRSCRSPQGVKVFGVPVDSHFASVMIQADYNMKDIANGNEETNLLFFNSFLDIELQDTQGNLKRGKEIPILIGTMNRFWFYPGDNWYVDHRDLVLLNKCELKLLTEQMHLNKKGMTNKGTPRPSAEKFAHAFSTFFPEIATQKPIFQELENLFRFVALAKILKTQVDERRITLNLDYLLKSHSIGRFPVVRQLPGRFNVKEIKWDVEHQGENAEMHVLLPCCGGVDIAPKVKQEKTIPRYLDCFLEKMSENISGERASGRQLSWSLDESFGSEFSATVLFVETETGLQEHIAIVLHDPNKGYYYCSGGRDDDIVKKLDTSEEFNRRLKTYNWGFKMNISRNQFNNMLSEAKRLVNGNHNKRIRNCADFAYWVLKGAGGMVNSGQCRVRPGDYICEIVKCNPGTILYKPILLEK